mmetsp:Transcript_29850/g.75980  ORF Transcript_29850/g.75980 Transcript_29850/m.75980 type:complete len:231 (-) Transcript_29850:360-1052(-)
MLLALELRPQGPKHLEQVGEKHHERCDPVTHCKLRVGRELVRHKHLLALLRVLLQHRLDLLAVSKVLVEFLAELREYSLFLLRQRTARRVSADQVRVNLLEPQEALEEGLLPWRVRQLVHGCVAQRVAVHGLELEEQVQLQPLNAVRVGCRFGGVLHRLTHAARHLLPLVERTDTAENLQRMQQQRLEEEHTRGVPDLLHEERELLARLRRTLQQPLLHALQPHEQLHML